MHGKLIVILHYIPKPKKYITVQRILRALFDYDLRKKFVIYVNVVEEYTVTIVRCPGDDGKF